MLPLETRKAIAADYASGAKVKVIALTYGIDESMPARIAKQFGVAPRRPNHRKVSDDAEKILCDFYVKSDAPMKVICAELGISLACASKVIKKRGIEKVRRQGKKPYRASKDALGSHVTLDMLEKRAAIKRL